MVQQLDPIILEGSGCLRGELNYYEYGVVSIKLELPFEADWRQLTERSMSEWMTDPEPEAQAMRMVRQCLDRARAALLKPNENWLSEDYYVIHVKDAGVPAPELIAQRGNEIAGIVRGEQARLSPEEVKEILGSRLSYYPDDLLVVGWTAAFIYDTDEGAASTIQLLEYANSQLLEFRWYDAAGEPFARRRIPLARKESGPARALASGFPG